MKRYLNAFFALLLCLSLCGVIFISDTTASATGETGTISGRVVDATSSDPVSGAVIYVFEYSSLSGPGWNLLGWTTTDTGGYYTTPSLPEGQYGVRFHATGYAIGWYEDAHTADDATPILVTAPDETPNINCSLEPGGPISGQVMDSVTGNSVSGAKIYVFGYESLSGDQQFYDWAITDTHGCYTTKGLRTGKYGVQVHAAGYATEWYEDTYTADDATPVSVTAPDETPHIDFILEPGQAGSPLTTPMASFVIEDARIHFGKKAGDDVIRVKGKFALDLVNGDGADISETVTVSIIAIGAYSTTVTGEAYDTITFEQKLREGNVWLYKRPKDGIGKIKDMTVNWNRGEFHISIDKADLTGLTNPVTVTIQIGDDLGSSSIVMKEGKHVWVYRSGPTPPMYAKVAVYGKGFLVERPNLRNFPPILGVRGTPYEMGYQHGYLMRDYIVDIYSAYLTRRYAMHGGWEQDGTTTPTPAQWEGGREILFSYYKTYFEDLVRTEVPELYQEVLGLAAGLEARYKSEGRECPVPLEDVLIINCIGTRGTDGGCSSFSAWGDATKNGETIHAKNSDFYTKGILKDIGVMIANPDGGNAFLAVLEPGILFSLYTGMSEEGISFSPLKSDSANVSPSTQISFSMMMRLALQFNDSIQDVYGLMDEYNGSSGNLLIVDGIGYEAPDGAVIEYSGSEIVIRYEDPAFLSNVIWATNHYNCYPGWQGYEGYNMVSGQMDEWGVDWEEVDTIGTWQSWLETHNQERWTTWSRYERYKTLISENHGDIDVFKAMEFQRDAEVMMGSGMACVMPVQHIAPTCVQMYGIVRPIIDQFLSSRYSVIFVPEDGRAWLAVGAKPAQVGTYWPISLTQYLQALDNFSFKNLIPDSDRDRMPDDWERAYHLDPNDPYDAKLDTDGDGKTNLEEYTNGTDPTTPVEYQDAPECSE